VINSKLDDDTNVKGYIPGMMKKDSLMNDDDKEY